MTRKTIKAIFKSADGLTKEERIEYPPKPDYYRPILIPISFAVVEDEISYHHMRTRRYVYRGIQLQGRTPVALYEEDVNEGERAS